MASEREREGGSWIGRQPDANTKEVRKQLDEDDERVAVTNTESSGVGAAGKRVQGSGDAWPGGHREGDSAGDDEVREAGETG